MADARRLLIGENPWEIFNLTDFILIGLMVILFFQSLNILTMAASRFGLFRVTGSASVPSNGVNGSSN